MLGDLRRHAADIDKREEESDSEDDRKTKETNCHVEGWFGIVKQHILRKEKTSNLHSHHVHISAWKVHRAHNAA